jgi:hypothetical protein
MYFDVPRVYETLSVMCSRMSERRRNRAISRGTSFAPCLSMAKPRKKGVSGLESGSDPNPPSPTAPPSAGDTTAAPGDRDRIAMRAYELYLARGRGEGAAMEDWLRAEQEMTDSRPSSRDSES